MKVRKKTNNLEVIGITISIIFGVPSLLSFIYGISNDNKQYLWAGACLLLVVVMSLIVKWVNKKYSKKDNEAYIRSCLGHGYFKEHWKNADLFIPMYIQEGNPSEYSDKLGKPSSERKRLMEYFVESFFQDKSDEGTDYCCLLGDSGSGKTSALVHLLINYVRKYHSEDRPYDIRIYSMSVGDKELWEKIESDFPTSKDKGHCILLLDALDDNLDIQKKLKNQNYKIENYFQKLAKKSQDFARVVVSCRQQLFDSCENEPKDTRIRISNGEEPYQQWKIFYLSPFDDSQINEFLHKKLKSDEIREANMIIKKNKDIFSRPLILSNIKDFLENYDKQKKECLTLKEIYDAIVLSWIRREPYPKGEKESQLSNLMNMSMCLAAYMFKHNLNAINNKHIEEYISEYKNYGIKDDFHLFRTRSLLTRIDNVYKFSHKSFFEYFLAYWFFLHPEDIGFMASGKDVLIVYNDICKARYLNKASDVDEILGTGNISLDNILNGMYKLGDSLIINRREEAKNQFSEFLTYYQNLDNRDKGNHLQLLSKTYNNLSVLHFMDNNIEDGMYYGTEELKCARELCKSDENNKEYRNSLMVALFNMAGYYRNFYNDNESAEKLEEEMKQYHGEFSNNINTLEIMNNPNTKGLIDSLLKIASDIAPGKDSFINFDFENGEMRIYYDEETMREIRKMNNIDEGLTD